MAIGPVYNEGEKAVRTIAAFPPGIVDEIVVVDDCSTDGSQEIIRQAGVTVLKTPRRSKPGTAIRLGIDYGLSKNVDIFVIFAMNGKDNPREIPLLLEPILTGRADFVQGSRYLAGGEHRHIPWRRLLAIRFYTVLFSVLFGKKITDATNGFRALRAEVVKDPKMNLWQEWLEGYPLETYLLAQVVRLGYRLCEVPVTKTYPQSGKNYSKIRPADWWACFKPVPLLWLGLKK